MFRGGALCGASLLERLLRRFLSELLGFLRTLHLHPSWSLWSLSLTADVGVTREPQWGENSNSYDRRRRPRRSRTPVSHGSSVHFALGTALVTAGCQDRSRLRRALCPGFVPEATAGARWAPGSILWSHAGGRGRGECGVGARAATGVGSHYRHAAPRGQAGRRRRLEGAARAVLARARLGSWRMAGRAGRRRNRCRVRWLRTYRPLAGAPAWHLPEREPAVRRLPRARRIHDLIEVSRGVLERARVLRCLDRTGHWADHATWPREQRRRSARHYPGATGLLPGRNRVP